MLIYIRVDLKSLDTSEIRCKPGPIVTIYKARHIQPFGVYTGY